MCSRAPPSLPTTGPIWQKLRCPSLILQHARDALAPLGVGQFLHQHLADSELQVLDVSGHCAHMSHPDLVIEAMRRYLAQPTRRT